MLQGKNGVNLLGELMLSSGKDNYSDSLLLLLFSLYSVFCILNIMCCNSTA